MVDKLLFVVTQKLAVLFVGGLSVVGGLLTMGATPIHTSANIPSAFSQIAIIESAGSALAPLVTPLSSSSSTAVSTTSTMLLPTTTTPFCPANTTSTCDRKNIQTLIQISASVKKAMIATAVPAATPTVITPDAPTPAPVKKNLQVTTPITAQSFLDDTTSSLKVLLDGSDELVFTTNLGGSGGGQSSLTWGLLTTTIGGTGSTPTFSVTSSCNPAPLPAAPGATDKNPILNVRTAYDCSVSLTPTSGSNQVTQSKAFSFATPPGQLVVTNDTAMNTVLADNTNNGGIVFNNQDTNPVTITGVTFDASYSYLNILNGPLVLRFLDPATNKSLADYHLEKIPATSGAAAGNGIGSTSNTYTYAQAGITIPLSFTIPPATQKMLPLQVLGVDRMFVLGTTPTVSITLRGVTTNESGGNGDVKTVMANPNITWSCAVSSASYDPNATSSAYATGQACLN